MSHEETEEPPVKGRFSRRQFIRGATVGTLGLWLTACGFGGKKKELPKSDYTETIKSRLTEILGEDTVQQVIKVEGAITVPEGNLSVFYLPDTSLKESGVPSRQVGMLRAGKTLIYSYSLTTHDPEGNERQWNAFLASEVSTPGIFKFQLDDEEKLATGGEGWAWTKEGYLRMLEEAKRANELIVFQDQGGEIQSILLFTPAVD